MALTWHESTYIAGKTYCKGECLSTDNKPVGDYIFNGSQLIELDTSTVYFFDGENQEWRAFG